VSLIGYSFDALQSLPTVVIEQSCKRLREGKKNAQKVCLGKEEFFENELDESYWINGKSERKRGSIALVPSNIKKRRNRSHGLEHNRAHLSIKIERLSIVKIGRHYYGCAGNDLRCAIAEL